MPSVRYATVAPKEPLEQMKSVRSVRADFLLILQAQQSARLVLLEQHPLQIDRDALSARVIRSQTLQAQQGVRDVPPVRLQPQIAKDVLRSASADSLDLEELLLVDLALAVL